MEDTDLMPFGKHEGKMMANVPADYLLYMYNTYWLYTKPRGFNQQKIANYVVKNYEILLKEKTETGEESKED